MVPETPLRVLLAAALRRFVFLFAVVAAGTAALSLAIGVLFGAGVSRSISLGFYGVGSFLLVAGFFVGNRGPVRVKGDPGFSVFGIFKDRRIRWASGPEQSESLNLSFVFVLLGVLLIALGVVADTRYKLV
jgi:hypothetical protein